MKTKTLYFAFTSLMFFLLFSGLSHSDDGTFTLCTERAYRLKYDDVLDRIIIICYQDMLNTPIHIINPGNNYVDRVFHLNGRVCQVEAINSGESLLVTMGEYDGNRSTTEGKLVELNYNNGSITRELLWDQELVHMSVDSMEENVYIYTMGMEFLDPNKIIKVSLSPFQVTEEITFGEFSDDMKLCNNSGFLYVETLNVFPDLSESQSKWGIGIFNTSNLTLSDRIVMEESPASHFEISDDGSELYICSGYVGYLEETGASLYVVDTSTNQIINTIHLSYNGAKCETECLVLDSLNNVLYCTAQPKVGEFYPQSNLIARINLDDYSYTFFPMGSNSLLKIALAPIPGGMRLFAIEKHNPVVHWIDLPS